VDEGLKPVQFASECLSLGLGVDDHCHGREDSAARAALIRFRGCRSRTLLRVRHGYERPCDTDAAVGLAAMGVWAVLLMAVVCVACGSAALGLLRFKRWGYCVKGNSESRITRSDPGAILAAPSSA
jgi:hypothetical protein